jgi:hypothetical protein
MLHRALEQSVFSPLSVVFMPWIVISWIVGNRDARYKLAGIAELDDAYFGSPTEAGKC